MSDKERDICQRCGTDWTGAPGHPNSYCDSVFNEAEVQRLKLQIGELKKQKDSCVPMDLTFYGYSKAMVTPPPTDEMDIQGVKCLRVVLTPQKPSCEIKLAGGREIHIDGWANKVQLGMDTPFCPHDAKTKKVQEELEKSNRLVGEIRKILVGAISDTVKVIRIEGVLAQSEKRKCGLAKPLGSEERCVREFGHLGPCDHRR